METTGKEEFELKPQFTGSGIRLPGSHSGFTVFSCIIFTVYTMSVCLTFLICEQLMMITVSPSQSHFEVKQIRPSRLQHLACKYHSRNFG
jgi:hypothetical protein